MLGIGKLYKYVNIPQPEVYKPKSLGKGIKEIGIQSDFKKINTCVMFILI